MSKRRRNTQLNPLQNRIKIIMEIFKAAKKGHKLCSVNIANEWHLFIKAKGIFPSFFLTAYNTQFYKLLRCFQLMYFSMSLMARIPKNILKYGILEIPRISYESKSKHQQKHSLPNHISQRMSPDMVSAVEFSQSCQLIRPED